LVTKKGLWDGVWRNIFGQAEEDEDEYVYYDEEEEEEALAQATASGKPASTSKRESSLSTA
jgi:protoheme IX farnesyltransferase